MSEQNLNTLVDEALDNIRNDRKLAREFLNELANEIVLRAKNSIQEQEQENKKIVDEKIKDEDLKNLNGMTISMLALLAKENILTLNDFADLASYELIDKEEGIFRKLELEEQIVNQMIMEAREKSFS